MNNKITKFVVMVVGFFFFFCILNDWNKTNLKLQLLEEPLVLVGLISLLEFDLGVLLRVGSLKTSLLTVILSKGISRVPCGAWGDYNYKLSQKTWSLTSWRFSSCPWQLSLCGDSDQFQPPEHGCRVGLRCHHQCSEGARITCYQPFRPCARITLSLSLSDPLL